MKGQSLYFGFDIGFDFDIGKIYEWVDFIVFYENLSIFLG